MFDGYVRCERLAHINLPRTTDSSGFVLTDLAIICDPARHTSYGKHYREHFQRDSDGSHHDAAVEINIWVELSLDEVGIVQGGLLEPQRDVQQRIADLKRFNQLVTMLFDDLCARIVVLVNAMAETHKSTPAFLCPWPLR